MKQNDLVIDTGFKVNYTVPKVIDTLSHVLVLCIHRVDLPVLYNEWLPAFELFSNELT